MITVYGVAGSRALRTLWMLEELELEHTHVPTHFVGGQTRTPEFLARNPNGHIPVLEDDDLVLWESMAINLYLAKRYDGGLQPRSVADEGRATMWSFWAMTELEPLLMEGIAHTFMLPEADRDPQRARRAEARCAGPLRVLNGALEGRGHLVGDAFGVADLNVAAVLSWAQALRYDLTPFPDVGRWLDDCLARPALARAQAR